MVIREARELMKRVFCNSVCAIRIHASDRTSKPAVRRRNKKEFVQFVEAKALHVKGQTVTICAMLCSGWWEQFKSSED